MVTLLGAAVLWLTSESSEANLERGQERITQYAFVAPEWLNETF
jgi:hypothetical protein